MPVEKILPSAGYVSGYRLSVELFPPGTKMSWSYGVEGLYDWVVNIPVEFVTEIILSDSAEVEERIPLPDSEL